MDKAEIEALVAGAGHIREMAYAPYSRYKVGAAVVSDDERVFFGCNVENASYSLSLCAERAAIASALAAGVRKIKAVVISTDGARPGMPCGACRQWMAEFGGDHLEVICANCEGELIRASLGKLLPDAFRLD